MTTLTIPYNWTPMEWHLPILRNKARFKVIVAHRKARKTTLAINELVRSAFAIRGTYWYVAPYYSQAKKIVWQEPEMLPKYIPPEIWAKRNNSELYVTFPNGSILYVLGADKPDSLRGPNPMGVVLDEYGDMKSNVWAGIIQPIMTANPHGWTWFMGTPKGQNDFYQKLQYAKNANNWYATVLRASESGILSHEALEEARLSTTQAYYKQEYECEFLEGAGSFFRRIEENTWSGELGFDARHSYQLGVDVAKYQDWTVITPFDKNTFKIGTQERFNQIDWNLQKARVEAAARRYNNARVVIDSTGVGDPIAEDLARAGLSLEPFKFTEASRRQLLDNLAILLEQDKIKIPNDEGLKDELKSMRFVMKTLESGKAKIHVEVSDGMTDDRIMSLALAVWGATEPIPESYDDGIGMYRRQSFE